VQSSTAKDLEEPRGRELLASISARDCSAMGEFYVSYFAPLVNFFAFLTAGDDLVEELISDTMLKAWRESATIGKTASVSVWISCEHVVEAAAHLAERLLGHAPSVQVMATSREPLRARSEWVLRLARRWRCT
jgi:hypothetical protein